MQSIKLKTRVGPDGILQLNVPVEFKDTDLEVMVVFQPLPTAVRVPNYLANQNETLRETQVRLAKIRQKYEGRTFHAERRIITGGSSALILLKNLL